MKILLTDIYWKNTTLFIEYSSPEQTEIFLKNGDTVISTEQTEISQNKYLAKINIVTTGESNRELLQGGYYSFVIPDFDYEENIDIFTEIPASDELILKARDIWKFFRYGKNNYAYTVSFSVINSENGVFVRMLAQYMRKNLHPKIRRPFAECKTLPKKIITSFLLFARKLCGLFYIICKFFRPLRGNRILFVSENRFNISANLSAIDKRLKERGLDSQYKIRYSFRNIFEKKYGLISSMILVAKIAESDYIFIDDYAPIFSLFKLRKNTVLVQTWHAGVGFKNVGYARFGISGSPHPFHSCHRMYTYGLVGCESLKEIYSEVWGIPESSIIASGMPRLDHFLDNNIIEKEKIRLTEKFPQIKDKRVLLFAPTYRGVSQKNAYYDFTRIDFEKLYNFCKNNNTIVIFKMHHFITEPVPIEDYMRDLFIEVTDEDINNLYYVSDVLITDYSSCFYDFSLLKKPILFYLYDENVYIATRGVQRPIEDVAPGKICHTFDEMLVALKNEDFEVEKLEKFYIDKAAEKGKLASDIVIDTVILKKEG